MYSDRNRGFQYSGIVTFYNDMTDETG